ncbi:MAG: hypothetical protein AAF458_24510 [Pseudomonadota bacterium]
MNQWKHMIASAACSAALGISVNASAVEGTCAHNEMRKWVDQEEVCYFMYGPLNERWRLDNYANLGTLKDCLRAAKEEYVVQRFICEARGDSPYRADRIHAEWEQYRTAYKAMTKRVQKR